VLIFAQGAAAVDENRWPGTHAGAPTPIVKGMPAELAKNLKTPQTDSTGLH
jgi:hypothetical protein